MKKQALKTVLALSLSIFSTFSLLAQDPNSLKPTISYLGKLRGKPLVKVEFENSSKASYQISIHDADGTLMYTKNFRDTYFAKSFLINIDEPENIRLKFTLSSENQKSVQFVEVRNTSVTKEEVLITKL